MGKPSPPHDEELVLSSGIVDIMLQPQISYFIDLTNEEEIRSHINRCLHKATLADKQPKYKAQKHKREKGKNPWSKKINGRYCKTRKQRRRLALE